MSAKALEMEWELKKAEESKRNKSFILPVCISYMNPTDYFDVAKDYKGHKKEEYNRIFLWYQEILHRYSKGDKTNLEWYKYVSSEYAKVYRKYTKK